MSIRELMNVYKRTLINGHYQAVTSMSLSSTLLFGLAISFERFELLLKWVHLSSGLSVTFYFVTSFELQSYNFREVQASFEKLENWNLFEISVVSEGLVWNYFLPLEWRSVTF